MHVTWTAVTMVQACISVADHIIVMHYAMINTFPFSARVPTDYNVNVVDLTSNLTKPKQNVMSKF